jgi:hypothetical protein
MRNTVADGALGHNGRSSSVSDDREHAHQGSGEQARVLEERQPDYTHDKRSKGEAAAEGRLINPRGSA